jgi:hypothetical protein
MAPTIVPRTVPTVSFFQTGRIDKLTIPDCRRRSKKPNRTSLFCRFREHLNEQAEGGWDRERSTDALQSSKHNQQDAIVDKTSSERDSSEKRGANNESRFWAVYVRNASALVGIEVSFGLRDK